MGAAWALKLVPPMGAARVSKLATKTDPGTARVSVAVWVSGLAWAWVAPKAPTPALLLAAGWAVPTEPEKERAWAETLAAATATTMAEPLERALAEPSAPGLATHWARVLARALAAAWAQRWAEVKAGAWAARSTCA